jgi:hypothetical protein
VCLPCRGSSPACNATLCCLASCRPATTWHTWQTGARPAAAAAAAQHMQLFSNSARRLAAMHNSELCLSCSGDASARPEDAFAVLAVGTVLSLSQGRGLFPVLLPAHASGTPCSEASKPLPTPIRTVPSMMQCPIDGDLDS